MNTPTWIKPGVYGLIVGGVATAVVGFSWGGWMTSSRAETMAKTRVDAGVAAALVPVCLQISQADPERVAKLATIRDAASYRRRDAVLATGWATPPGAETPNRALAEACIDALDLDET